MRLKVTGNLTTSLQHITQTLIHKRPKQKTQQKKKTKINARKKKYDKKKILTF